MAASGHMYIAIDLKSFYASVECRERGLDPLTTNLVVADAARTDKTICLAVSPSLKAYGIAGRPRLFEVIQRVKLINAQRKAAAYGRCFTGSSVDAKKLQDTSLQLAYITAVPRMALYLAYSTNIYKVYLRYLAPEDIHVYSIDEVMIDAAPYLKTYGISARELAALLVREVLAATGITATAGIGTNLYLCKVAMDIVAKHLPADAAGVRIAELDEMSYRRLLWEHQPLTDFWRVGRGYAKKLEAKGLKTMGDIAKCSLGSSRDFYNEDLLYEIFGVNAELLIDHAWGWEPCTLSDIKAYVPQERCLSSGQVLMCPYDYEKTKLIIKEMAEQLALDLVSKRLLTEQLVLTISYDVENLQDSSRAAYAGALTVDAYGRVKPKHAHGTIKLTEKTASAKLLVRAALELYERIINPRLLTRKINITAGRVCSELVAANAAAEIDLFAAAEAAAEQEKLQRERRLQQAVLDIKKRYGKNALLKGMNFLPGATMKERNAQIGGHKA